MINLDGEVRAISLTEPWASLVKLAATRPDLGKRIETRDHRWIKFQYRGPVVIQASKLFPGWARDWVLEALRLKTGNLYNALLAMSITSPLDLGKFGCGNALCVANLVDIQPTSSHNQNIFGGNRKVPEVGTPDYDFGNFTENRAMLFLEGITELKRPYPLKGSLSLIKLDDQQKADIRLLLQ